MTWIKICGVTNLEDAKVAVDAGADALGFVFYERSPRKIGVDAAREIISQLPARVEKVGVFVITQEQDIDAVVKEAKLGAVQLHAVLGQSESAEPKRSPDSNYKDPNYKTYVALPVAEFFNDGEDFARFLSPEGNGRVSAVFLDSGTLAQPGGTGKTFNWEKAMPVAQRIRHARLKLVVAGGLNPNNVADAKGILNPWGVDVSSGVEASPGKKDPKKVRAFIAAVRAAERDKNG